MKIPVFYTVPCAPFTPFHTQPSRVRPWQALEMEAEEALPPAVKALCVNPRLAPLDFSEARRQRLLLEQHEQPREGGEEGGVEVGRGLQEPRAGGSCSPHPAAAAGGPTDAGGQTETGPSSAGALVAARASAGAQLALFADADLRSFPEGRLDESRQPLDLSGKNSWSRRLGEVSTAELLHTMAANAIAPFVLCSRLRPLLSAPEGTAPWGHIINVSALEGKFSVSGKKSMRKRIGMCIILGS